jgi:hypothetical protein
LIVLIVLVFPHGVGGFIEIAMRWHSQKRARAIEGKIG